MAKQFLTLKIKESPRQIESLIQNALVRRLGNPTVLKVAASLASADIRVAFRRALMQSNTYQDLISDTSVLRGEMGLTNPVGKLDDLINIWSQSIKFTFRKVTRSALGISGGFTIKFNRASWADVLSSSSAKQDNTHSRSGNPPVLNWLEWLLIRGDESIIIGYDASFAERHGASSGRTGLAIMIKPKIFRSWSVPPGYSGTKDRNFVTQVLDKMEQPVCIAIEKGLKTAVRRLV